MQKSTLQYMMWTDARRKTMQKDTLTPEAKRALAEADARRRQAEPASLPPEVNGRKGPEPTRFGDWESKGITSDF